MEEKENTTMQPQENTDEKVDAQPQEAVEVIEKEESGSNLREKLLEELNRRKKIAKEADEAIGQGKGILHLETPIKSGSGVVEELPYDFMALTGLEFTDALDSSPSPQQSYNITNRQALSLFAAAAAKQTASLDRKDIVERIGVTDAVEAVQLATLFFRASSMAGRMRITKKQ